jgi:hypothetical protein
MREQSISDALVDALSALARAEAAVQLALSMVGSDAPPVATRLGAAVRTTSTQVVSVLATASEPLELRDIADGVCAIRRGEDVPKGRGGTRYGEMCRTAISRLIERGMVVRVEPTDKNQRMRFALATRARNAGSRKCAEPALSC